MTTEPNLAEQSPRSFRIDEELDQVLRSTSFQGSKQCQALLRYLVEKSIGGQDGDASLKERTIGVEVFGRKLDYNTADDAIVRARVGEVRKRLAQYYLGPEGQGSAIEIVISPRVLSAQIHFPDGENRWEHRTSGHRPASSSGTTTRRGRVSRTRGRRFRSQVAEAGPMAQMGYRRCGGLRCCCGRVDRHTEMDKERTRPLLGAIP